MKVWIIYIEYTGKVPWTFEKSTENIIWRWWEITGKIPGRYLDVLGKKTKKKYEEDLEFTMKVTEKYPENPEELLGM